MNKKSHISIGLVIFLSSMVLAYNVLNYEVSFGVFFVGGLALASGLLLRFWIEAYRGARREREEAEK